MTKEAEPNECHFGSVLSSKKEKPPKKWMPAWLCSTAEYAIEHSLTLVICLSICAKRFLPLAANVLSASPAAIANSSTGFSQKYWYPPSLS
ncbi:MAG TPA: hypothetical protein VJ946_09425, partial [Bacteroidales bacterium]|nr:hypothetical protein [Bacteroidales bacterium]